MIEPEIEARLVAELRGGDERARAAALSELFGQLGRPLFQLCLRIACDPTDAEDALQETFVDVLRGLPGFRADARFSTWVFRIAIRAAMRVRSRRDRAGRHDLSSLDGLGLEQVESQNGGRDAQDPGELAQQRESAANVLAAIERLPAAQRTVLGLAALDDMPQTEIAAILGIPVGTVYSRLNTARERLREELAR